LNQVLTIIPQATRPLCFHPRRESEATLTKSQDNLS
jgi:hypothetical protein